MADKIDLLDKFHELLECVNMDTGSPKFPKRATALVREISAYSRGTRLYERCKGRGEGFSPDGTPPDDIFFYMLDRFNNAPNFLFARGSIILLMPLLEQALDGQRRCRVCGCSDNNACIPFSCYWVEDDLCSACAGKEAENVR